MIKVLDLEGCIVSTDAMGCQQSIAEDIIGRKADYLLSVKNNQLELYQGMEDTFRFEKQAERTFARQTDIGHGRIENRTSHISSHLEHIPVDKWKNIQTVIKIESQR